MALRDIPLCKHCQAWPQLCAFLAQLAAVHSGITGSVNNKPMHWRCSASSLQRLPNTWNPCRAYRPEVQGSVWRDDFVDDEAFLKGSAGSHSRL